MARPKKQEITSTNSNNKKASLISKILKNANSDMASILSESTIFSTADMIPTEIPILNLAFSGSLKGGFSGGLITIAGPSKHFKSSFGLAAMKAFQEKYEDGIVIFYDSEGGISKEYLKMHGIDMDRVVYDFVTDVEELKHKIVPQLDGLERGDPVMIFVDSLGNLSSKREYDNAIEGNTATDMTRAKEIKSLTRLINGKLKIKKIPCIVINHSYQTLEMYSKAIVGGGTGIMYSSDTVFIIGRQQDKNKTTGEIEGWNFTITIEKSRSIKEKSKFNVSVKYDGGIQKYSGLSELAEEMGIITAFKGGFEFNGVQTTTKDVDADDKFWEKILNESDFEKLLENKFMLGKGGTFEAEESGDDIE